MTKFGRKHKVPIQRSAFTYCEDDVPSGLDLGKNKYGGPFTTEQVGDVKAFYGILKVIFAVGLAFFLDIASDPLLFFYTEHVSSIQFNVTVSKEESFNKGELRTLLLHNGLLSPLIIIVSIPFYILFIRPFAYNYIPNMLKRIGFGILLILTSVSCTFVMETVAHLESNVTATCMLSYLPGISYNTSLHQDSSGVLVQRCLSSFSRMLIYIAWYEFICAQSPHTMKGLLIGLSFAIKGLFELLAAAVVIPFSLIRQSMLSCGMDYYLLNMGVGVVALVIYIYVSRRYEQRERDEPCHVQRFVEEYYYKIQEET